jgi:hypothetical protein
LKSEEELIPEIRGGTENVRSHNIQKNRVNGRAKNSRTVDNRGR